MAAASKGRRGATGTFTDTVSAKSAEQAILIKQDEMIDKMNALAAALAVAVDVADVNAAATAFGAIVKVKLV